MDVDCERSNRIDELRTFWAQKIEHTSLSANITSSAISPVGDLTNVPVTEEEFSVDDNAHDISPIATATPGE